MASNESVVAMLSSPPTPARVARPASASPALPARQRTYLAQMSRTAAAERSLPPPTPRTMLAASASLWAVCRRCNHARRLDVAALAAGPHADRPLRDLPLRCAVCATSDPRTTGFVSMKADGTVPATIDDRLGRPSQQLLAGRLAQTPPRHAVRRRAVPSRGAR